MSHPYSSASAAQRRKDLKEEEEDGAVGNLGTQFQTAQALMISEVKFIVDQMDTQTENPSTIDDVKFPTPNNLIYKKTMDYVNIFSRYNHLETVRDVRQSMIDPNLTTSQIANANSLQLTPYEANQLTDLGIENVEEAKTLVPTLASKDTDKLANLLEELSNQRRFQ